jgi:uncharacterized membrane protein
VRVWGWYLGILAVVLGCWGYLILNFHLVPDPMPTHFGPGGEADGWSRKSLGTALGLVGMGPVTLLVVGAGASGLNHALAREAGERQQLSARLMSPVLAAWLFVLATLIAVGVTVSLLGHHGPLTTWGLLGGMVLATVVMAWRIYLVNRAVDTAHPPGEKEKSSRWGFYFNPDDPETMVSLENGSYTTLNFARPGAWGILAMLLGPMIVLVIVAAVAG